jgi:hypothetical protein
LSAATIEEERKLVSAPTQARLWGDRCKQAFSAEAKRPLLRPNKRKETHAYLFEEANHGDI